MAMRGFAAAVGLLILLSGCESTRTDFEIPPIEPIVGSIAIGNAPLDGVLFRSRDITRITGGGASGTIERNAVWSVDKVATEDEVALTARLRELSFASTGAVEQDGLSESQMKDLIDHLAVLIAINVRTGQTSVKLAGAENVQAEMGKMSHAFETFGESLAAAYLGGRELIQGQELHVLDAPGLAEGFGDGVAIDVVEQVSGRTAYGNRPVVVIDGGGTVRMPGGDVFFVKGRSLVDVETGIHAFTDMTIEAYMRARGVTIRQRQTVNADFGRGGSWF